MSPHPRYRKYLNRLAEPIIARLASRYAKGLDFGSGPEPAVPLIFGCAGHECVIYDKFYADDKAVLTNKNYDFISSSEVVEHLSNPGATFHVLFSLLGQNGILGVMTKLYSSNQDFGNWYYKNDPTHITLYTQATMSFIAKKRPSYSGPVLFCSASHYSSQIHVLGRPVGHSFELRCFRLRTGLVTNLASITLNDLSCFLEHTKYKKELADNE